MSKPYQPTGRPPGRPKRPEVEKQGIRDVRARLAETTADRRNLPLFAWCPDCFPEGFPVGQTALSCPHGVWVRRIL